MMSNNKGCEYCKGRAYTKKPLTVITKYGRRIELVFDYCPKCGRRIKPIDENFKNDKEKLINICDTMIKECRYGDCDGCAAKSTEYSRCMGVHFADVLIKNNVIKGA